jgi:hypothetical protein
LSALSPDPEDEEESTIIVSPYLHSSPSPSPSPSSSSPSSQSSSIPVVSSLASSSQLRPNYDSGAANQQQEVQGFRDDHEDKVGRIYLMVTT